MERISKAIHWQDLNTINQVELIKEESNQQPILIFKHSTRCSVSRMVLDRLERNWNQGEMGDMKTYFLDLISHRPISEGITESFGVEHESPQVLIIHHGKAVDDWSHMSIDYNRIKGSVKQ